jgi:hypothetical protein
MPADDVVVPVAVCDEVLAVVIIVLFEESVELEEE